MSVMGQQLFVVANRYVRLPHIVLKNSFFRVLEIIQAC